MVAEVFTIAWRCLADIGLCLKAWAASPGTSSGAYLSLQINLVQATPQCTG